MRRFSACLLALAFAGVARADIADLPIDDFRTPAANLPAPGPSSAPGSIAGYAALEAAEAARQRGLAAVEQQDWTAAAAAFEEARAGGYHCAPDVIFNLGLASARANLHASGALWLRTYIVMQPEAENAAAIRSEIARLADVVDARSVRLYDEAERLTATLPTTPGESGAPSLRQLALRSVTSYTYMGNDLARGDRLLAQLRAFPNTARDEFAELRTAPNFVMQYLSNDLVGMEENLAGPARGLPAAFRDGALLQVLVDRGEVSRVERTFRGLSFEEFGRLNYAHATRRKIWEQRYFDILSRYQVGALESRLSERTFNEGVYTYSSGLMQDAFFAGRPDVARDIAVPLRRYFERHDRGDDLLSHRTSYLLILAVLGESRAMRDYLASADSYPLRSMYDRIALVSSMTMSAADASALMNVLARMAAYHYEDQPNPEQVWLRAQPLAGMAAQAIRGEAPVLRGTLEAVEDWRLALQFAVASGRDQLAFDLIRRMPATGSISYMPPAPLPAAINLPDELTRMATRHGASAQTRAQVDAYFSAACRGWRPSSREHALEVWWRANRANFVGPSEDAELPVDLERFMEEAPQDAPPKLAALAAALRSNAHAARLER